MSIALTPNSRPRKGTTTVGKGEQLITIPGEVIQVDQSSLKTGIRRAATIGAGLATAVTGIYLAEQFVIPTISNELAQIQQALNHAIQNYQHDHTNILTNQSNHQEVPPPNHPVDRSQPIHIAKDADNYKLTDEQYQELCMPGAHLVEIGGETVAVETITPTMQAAIVKDAEKANPTLTWQGNKGPDTTQYKFNVIPLPDTLSPNIENSQYKVAVTQEGVLELITSGQVVATFDPYVADVGVSNFNYASPINRDNIQQDYFVGITFDGAWITPDVAIQNQAALAVAEKMDQPGIPVDHHQFTINPDQIILYQHEVHGADGTPYNNLHVKNTFLDQNGTVIYIQSEYDAIRDGNDTVYHFTIGNQSQIPSLAHNPSYLGLYTFGKLPADYSQNTNNPYLKGGLAGYQQEPYVLLS